MGEATRASQQDAPTARRNIVSTGCRAAALLALLALGWPAGAQADSAARAKELFQQGQVLYRQGKFSDALARFQEAAQHVSKPSITLNMAQCHRNLGNDDKALFFYKLYLDEWPRHYPDKPPFYEQEVNQHIKALRSRIRARKLREAAAAKVKPGRIRVLGLDIPRVQVLVDDAPRAVSPVTRPIQVKPGKHVVRVDLAGYEPFSREVQVKPGQQVDVVVTLMRLPQWRRNPLWLIGAVGGGALAVAGGAVGLYYNLEANKHYRSEDHFDDRDLAIAGYVAGGVMLGVGVTSLVMYVMSQELVETGAPGSAPMVGVAPAPGGAAASVGWRF